MTHRLLFIFSIKHLPLVFFLSLFAVRAYAQVGVLDNSFSQDGYLIQDIDGHDWVYSMASQADGKVIVIGYCASESSFIARYNVDGSPDQSFGYNGILIKYSCGQCPILGEPIEFLSNGIIVVAESLAGGCHPICYGGDEFGIVLYNQNGHEVGYIRSMYEIRYITVQPDDKILALDHKGGLTRFNPDGTLDTGFATGGVLNLGSLSNKTYTVFTILPDGKILLPAWSISTGDVFVRLNPDGTPDNSFGNGGVQTADFYVESFSSPVRSIATQPDGQIIVHTPDTLSGFNSDGTPDLMFGTNGFKALGVSNNKMTLQSDGKILVVGSVLSDSSRNISLARYLVDGTLDEGFGNNGIIITDLGGRELGQVVDVQADGKIVVAGQAHVYDSLGQLVGPDLFILRYLNDLNTGVLDFSAPAHSVLVYPNPIKRQAVLKYTLKKEESISIYLLDLQGKVIKTFLNNVAQASGEQVQQLDFPENMPPGQYSLLIKSTNGQVTVNIIK